MKPTWQISAGRLASITASPPLHVRRARRLSDLGGGDATDTTIIGQTNPPGNSADFRDDGPLTFCGQGTYSAGFDRLAPPAHRMKFGLLGNDLHVLPLAKAAVELGHRLVWLGECDDLAGELKSLAPDADAGTDWEALLAAGTVEVVILGRAGDPAARRMQARSLVQAGVSLLVAQPLERSADIYYELEMDRRETGAVLRHYTPGARHPALLEFARLCEERSATHAATWQLVFERTLSDLHRDTVFDQFVRDAEILERLAGMPNQVSAMAGSETPSGSHLSLQIAFQGGLLANWSTRSAASRPAAEAMITAVGDSGRIVLRAGPAEDDWLLEASAGDANHVRSLGANCDARRCIEEMVESVSQRSGDSDWTEAVHFVEMGEAVQASLRRGRGVKVSQGENTEAAAFKATMASAGCLMLLACVMLAVLLGFLEALSVPVGRFWWSLAVVALAAFLALQGLLKFAVPRGGDT